MDNLTINCVESSLGVETLDSQGNPFSVSFAAPIRSALRLRLESQYQLSTSIDCLTPRPAASRHKTLSGLLKQVALRISNAMQSCKPFVVIGGDHSCAMGTWRGAMQGMEDSSQLGLIWIDAHMDAHNFSTSPSGNVHGMALSALLGQGDEQLNAIYSCDRYLDSSNLVLLGVRSFESAEKKMIDSKKISVAYQYPDSNIKKQLLHSYKSLSENCKYIGISIDLDVLDPGEVCIGGDCAIATPVDNGISVKKLLCALRELPLDEKFLGLEIAEYYPMKDNSKITLNIIADIIGSLFSRQ